MLEGTSKIFALVQLILMIGCFTGIFGMFADMPEQWKKWEREYGPIRSKIYAVLLTTLWVLLSLVFSSNAFWPRWWWFKALMLLLFLLFFIACGGRRLW